MGCLLTKYDQLKHDKYQVYMEILRILDTYQEATYHDCHWYLVATIFQT